MSNLVLEVRGSEPELIVPNYSQVSDYTDTQLEELRMYRASKRVPVYVDYLQSSEFTSYSWTISGPSGYTQISPQKTTTSFVFVFDVLGKYTATITASNPSEGWSESVTLRFLVSQAQPFSSKFPDMDFMYDLLPDIYSWSSNTKFLSTVWSTAASLVAQELTSLVEVDQTKSLQNYPDFFQRKWIQANPQLDEFGFRNFLFLKPITDSGVVASAGSLVITPNNPSKYSQLFTKKRFTFKVKDYNSLEINSPPSYLLGAILKVDQGSATGFTFKVESLQNNSITVTPRLPASLSEGSTLQASSSTLLNSKGLLLIATDTAGTSLVRSITNILPSSQTLEINEPLPAGSYDIEIHSIMRSTLNLEDLGVSEGDKLVVEISRQDYVKTQLPLEVYKVQGNVAAIRTELSDGTSFTDLEVFLALNDLKYPGVFLNSDYSISFQDQVYVTTEGVAVAEMTDAEAVYSVMSQYPEELLLYEVFPTTQISIGTVFQGTISPKYIVRNTKIPNLDDMVTCNSLQNYFEDYQEYVEDGLVKRVTAEGDVFIQQNPSMTLHYGADYEIIDGFIQFLNFSYRSPAPRQLWGSLALFSTDSRLENSFGKAAKLSLTEYESLTSTLSYKEVVNGLLFSYCNGATLRSVEIGLHLLLDIPIVTSRSQVLALAEPVGEELLYQVVDLEDLSTRNIFLPRREYVSPEFSPISVNRETGDYIEVGDALPAFSPLSQFIKVEDNVGRSEHPSEVHKWTAIVDVSVVDSSLIPKTKQYLDEIRPVYTKLDFVFVLFLVDLIAVQEGSFGLDLSFYLIDNIGPYQSYSATDSSHLGAILRRFDSPSWSVQSYSYGRGLEILSSTKVDPNADPNFFNPYLAEHTEIIHEIFGSSPIETNSEDSVLVGDVLVIATGLSQGIYSIDSINQDGTWDVSPVAGENLTTPIPDREYHSYYVMRLDTATNSDSDDTWEEVLPQDIPYLDMDFGSNTISGSSGTLTQDETGFANSSTFEVLNVRSGDIIIIDSVEHDILTVSGNSITIADQSTFGASTYTIRRFL